MSLFAIGNARKGTVLIMIFLMSSRIKFAWKCHMFTHELIFLNTTLPCHLFSSLVCHFWGSTGFPEILSPEPQHTKI